MAKTWPKLAKKVGKKWAEKWAEQIWGFGELGWTRAWPAKVGLLPTFLAILPTFAQKSGQSKRPSQLDLEAKKGLKKAVLPTFEENTLKLFLERKVYI